MGVLCVDCRLWLVRHIDPACGGPHGDALEVMGTGKINTEVLVTHVFPLEDIKEAFETGLNRDEAIKVWVKP